MLRGDKIPNARLSVSLTEEQREALQAIFQPYHGLQQKAMACLIDELLKVATPDPNTFLFAVMDRRLEISIKKRTIDSIGPKQEYLPNASQRSAGDNMLSPQEPSNSEGSVDEGEEGEEGESNKRF